MRLGLLLTLITANLATEAHAAELVTLRESFPADAQYHVRLRVELDGRMSVAIGEPAKSQILTVSGTSALQYDERVLRSDDASLLKVIRQYQQVEFQRKLGERDQKAGVRAPVRRMVVIRSARGKSPFSPDGPLTWNEIDVVKNDPFCPALIPDLLPARPVKPGDQWQAGPSAVVELTDMEKVDEGSFTIQFQAVTMLQERRHARLLITGTVRGIDDHGPCRHSLDGTAYFDLEANRLVYLSLKGTHELLDAKGTVNGRVNGRFVLERGPSRDVGALSEAKLARLELNPTIENSTLLYENEELGVRLLYPRRWRVGAVQGRQLTLDGPNGAGLLVTLEPTARVPTAPAYLQEIEEFLKKQKAVIANRSSIDRVRDQPLLDRFGLDAELSGEKLRMEYGIVRQVEGGIILAARLPRQDATVLGKDVDAIAKSLSLTRSIR